MSWLRTLDNIDGATPASVGYDAYYLGELRKRRLPVAEGWVITSDLWQRVLHYMVRLQPHLADRLENIDLNSGEKLRHLSRTWRQNLDTVCASSPLAIEYLRCPCPQWTMRSSLGFPLPREQLRQWVLPLHRQLPEIVSNGSGQAVAQALKQLWGEGLKACNLVVWQQHCRALSQLRLGSLILPLYPAQVSGRLSLAAGVAYLEAVEGLGVALRRGEAIPARCRIVLAQLDQQEWQPGHQELVYQLPSASNSPVSPTANDDDQAIWHLAERSPVTLDAPLNQTRVEELLQLGQQAQAALSQAGGQGDGVQLEWALCSTPTADNPVWIITQAMPWFGTESSETTLSAAPSDLLPEFSERRLPGRRSSAQLAPPALPQVSVVVKGIGASAGRVSAPAVIAQCPQDLPEPLPPGCIVVLPDLQPDRFLQLRSAAGIITEQGGATCHAAILAREMGIPAVVGAPQATQLLDPDLMLWMDGERGLVYGLPDDALSSPQPSQPDRFPHLTRVKSPPPTERLSSTTLEQLNAVTTQYPRQTKVMVNLSQSSRVKDLPVKHLDGIGLLRSEWLILEILDQRHPWHWIEQGQAAELQARLAQILAPILQALGDKPLRYRSLDLRSNEWQSLEGSPPLDANPMLGLRGTLSYTLDPRLFEVELGALATLQQAGHHNLQLMLPFVRSVEEVIVCRQYIDRAGLSQDDGFALWIMAEVPSVLFLLSSYARAGIQGIAIGSNDLTQLLLAVDRDQHTIASAYDEQHPVVRLALRYLIEEARRNGMTCSICGQAPVRHPDLIADLVAWGIDSISVEVGALPFSLKAVSAAEQNQARKLPP
jgi:pyruvate,water dikinase